MTFKDAFPLEIEFEIDRDRLLRISRIEAGAACFGLASIPSLMMTTACFSASMAPYRHADMWYQLGWFGIYLMVGLGAWVAIGGTIYFSYFHAATRLRTNNLRLLVDGPFLRLVSGGYVVRDRRFHFRDVSSYETIEGPLQRRFGLKSLRFRISDSGNAPPLSVVGLVDPESVRDVLCEIDASRELPGSLVTQPNDHPDSD